MIMAINLIQCLFVEHIIIIGLTIQFIQRPEESLLGLVSDFHEKCIQVLGSVKSGVVLASEDVVVLGQFDANEVCGVFWHFGRVTGDGGDDKGFGVGEAGFAGEKEVFTL